MSPLIVKLLLQTFNYLRCAHSWQGLASQHDRPAVRLIVVDIYPETYHHPTSMSAPEVYPLAVLIDELKHDDTPTRVTAMERLPTVALALGEDRCRAELIPFLCEVAKEDEDEILTLLAEQLGDFAEYIGGAQYTHLLVEPLALLVVSEEPVVRDTAVKSLAKLAPTMDKTQLQNYIVPLVLSLTTSDWFSSRIGAAALFPVAIEQGFDAATHESQYPPDTVAELYSGFSSLATDDAPMVRRACGTHLPEVVKCTHDPSNLEKLVPVFLSLCQDAQDSVKLLAVDCAVALAEQGGAAIVPQLTGPVFGLLEDKSWRVRYQAADRFGALSHAVLPQPNPETAAKLLDTFGALAVDPEAEVRAAIAKQVVAYTSDLVDVPTVLSRVIPALEALTNDPGEGVREALAGQIAKMAPKVGTDNTVAHLLPLFLDMLRDEDSEVRLRIISNLDVINETIGIDRLSESLLPAISDLAKDKQWRVLLAVIDYSPLLAKQLGVEFFNRELVPLVFQWLWDPVWAIRDAAAENLKALADVCGIDWLEQEIVPKLMESHGNGNYLYRLTSLLTLKKIADRLTPDTLAQAIVPFIVEMSHDPVPNVRFNCATTLAIIATRIAPTHGSLIKSTIIPNIERLTEDPDVDVRFFAGEARVKALRA